MKTETPRPDELPKATSESTTEVRKWAFEKALLCKNDTDIVEDVIFKAAEIEAYITKGKNPRDDFKVCVDVALSEVDVQAIPNVGEDLKRKVMEAVRKSLEDYDAL